jgi:Ni,Fe-hydrogenase III large subunit
MSQRDIEEVISSKFRLKIADLISVRPRTLRELKALTGLGTVQGVLKHLTLLKNLGLVKETSIEEGALSSRRIYSVNRGVHVRDFSYRDMTVVKLSTEVEQAVKSSNPVEELESLATDALVQKSRIRDQAKKLGRMIDELVSTEARIGEIARAVGADDENRLLLQIAFTEESLEDAEKLLKEQYGVVDARRSLEKAISKARRVAKK